jgi:hypothetical protein
MKFVRRIMLIASIIAGLGGSTCYPDEPSVFHRPALMEASQQFQLRGIFCARNNQLDEALEACEGAIRIAPFSATAHYLLAAIYAKRGEAEDCVKTLKRAQELGFRDVAYLERDPDLATVRKHPEFANLIAEAKKPFERPAPKPAPLKLGVALVGPENGVWDESTNLVRTSFNWKGPNKTLGIIRDHGEVGRKLWKWNSEKTASGNYGDLYDNCDKDHSNLKYEQFPQLYRIEYQPELGGDIPSGLQYRILHGGVVIGNSSTAMTGGPNWRSNPRLAYVKPASMAALTRQYFQNHLYVYPEHMDHDPGHNGKSFGYGDVYPANTPYVLISQGSSYSDQPFLDVLACMLAAFRPEVKKLLVERGWIAPTLQQIFRSNYQPVKKPDDYLTGVAHPSVFEATMVDPLRLIEATHAMTVDTIPPLARIRVEKQDQAIVGLDYFETGAYHEYLFDTPCAIARIGRSVRYRRQMTVSAGDSVDVNKKPLRFEWVVLRGDESLIKIEPLDKTGSRAELTVAWHPRRKILPESNLESNRVDIGVFAHNGSEWSAPAFVTWYFLDNEDREYDEQQRIRSVSYHGGTDEGNYTDPLIQTPKTWKDTYRYTDDGLLIGWTRTRGLLPSQESEEFTPAGKLVIERDEKGRPLVAKSVVYIARPGARGTPTLVQLPSEETWHYTYSGPDDLIGKIQAKAH